MEQNKVAMAKWAAKEKPKWKLGLRLKKHKRGDEQNGLVYWGMLRGKEWWVTPENFEHLRQVKNASARKSSKTPEQRAKHREQSRKRVKTPESRAKANARQRKRNHIYTVRYRARRRAYKKMRLATDPLYKFKANFSRCISLAVQRGSGRKSSHSNVLLGCTFEFFRGWLQSGFTPEMSWNNYGTFWTIDHIIAVDLFDMADPLGQQMAFNYKNTRPLEKLANIAKSNRLNMELVRQYKLEAWLPFVREEAQRKMDTANIIPFQQEAA